MLRQVHQPGQKLFVDWAGLKVPIHHADGSEPAERVRVREPPARPGDRRELEQRAPAGARRAGLDPDALRGRHRALPVRRHQQLPAEHADVQPGLAPSTGGRPGHVRSGHPDVEMI